jgi:hypothetical protein
MSRVLVVLAALLALSVPLVAAADEPPPPPVSCRGEPPTDVGKQRFGELLAPGVLAPRGFAGAHPDGCFDRLVFPVLGHPVGGALAAYMDPRTLTTDPAGLPLEVTGAAALVVRIPHEFPRTSARPRDGQPVIELAGQGLEAVESVVSGGSFEGLTVVVIGTRDVLGYRLFAVPTAFGGALVVDIRRPSSL